MAVVTHANKANSPRLPVPQLVPTTHPPRDMGGEARKQRAGRSIESRRFSCKHIDLSGHTSFVLWQWRWSFSNHLPITVSFTVKPSTLTRRLRRCRSSSGQSYCGSPGYRAQASPRWRIWWMFVSMRWAGIPSLHGHRLRKIARLVDVGAPRTRRVIGKQLQRHHMQDR